MTALAKIEPLHTQTMVFDDNQIHLLKTTICKGASDDELRFFIYACQRTGLDPFARQIYSVPRGGQRVIQTSVDGFRLIADRSGKYAPGKETSFTYDAQGNLQSATAYVKKQTKDGTWHEISANARFDEYDGKNNFWKTKSHIMLSKCAECLALRKAFPAEMSGLYGQDEMDQADVRQSYFKEKLSQEQVIELVTILNGCSIDYQKQVYDFLPKKYKVDILDEVPSSEYDVLKKAFTAKKTEYQKFLVEKEMTINVEEIKE